MTFKRIVNYDKYIIQVSAHKKSIYTLKKRRFYASDCGVSWRELPIGESYTNNVEQ